jgi:hypothetical protein
MKRLILLGLYFFYTQIASGQEFTQYAPDIPKAATYSTGSIAQYIQANFKTEQERISAIYSWVITNIKYDKDSMYYINWSMYPQEKIAATLRRRKGVCENYAALFTDINLKCGIQSFVVSGYTKQDGSVNSAGHSWCAVLLQNEWYLCDPTWDAGFSGKVNYFLIRPLQFIESHFPFDPLWQLLEHPISDQDFRSGNFYVDREKTIFNFADSVKVFLQLDSLRQLEASAKRIKQTGIQNERVKNWLAFNQMKIAIVYGEKDMNLYNAAVADLNNASSIFNRFVQYRNSRFEPVRSDAAIKAMLDPISGLLKSASENLDKLGQIVENFQYDASSIKSRIDNLAKRLKEQQTFLKQYFSTSVLERPKLFFK